MSRLTRFERETIILFNEGDDEANIFTYNTKWQAHLERKLGLRPYDTTAENGRSYKLPKRYIRLPLAPRVKEASGV